MCRGAKTNCCRGRAQDDAPTWRREEVRARVTVEMRNRSNREDLQGAVVKQRKYDSPERTGCVDETR